MAIIYCYGDNPLADGHAKEAAEVLSAAYPNHSWWVECRQGILLIKHFSISDRLGMVRRLADLAGDANTRKRDIVRAAGELLERAGLARRDFRGEDVQDFDVDRPLKKHWRRQMRKIEVIH